MGDKKNGPTHNVPISRSTKLSSLWVIPQSVIHKNVEYTVIT